MTSTAPKKTLDHLSFFQRFLVIIQLCLAISLLLWSMGQPFLGEYFNIRSQLLIYEFVQGISPVPSKPSQKWEQNKKKWESLPEEKKIAIRQDYKDLKEYAERPTTLKIVQGVGSVLDLPPFELAWIFFSIWISILLLKGRSGSSQTVWLIPIIALFYAIDNRISGDLPRPELDLEMIPSEQTLFEGYVDEKKSSYWLEQREQLLEGWNRYLVKNYLHQEWNEDTKEQQIAQAEYIFTMARLEKHGKINLKVLQPNLHEKSNPVVLTIIVLWNLFFAIKLTRHHN
jgi:hypothetical protein